jgi:hypothetical protein
MDGALRGQTITCVEPPTVGANANLDIDHDLLTSVAVLSRSSDGARLRPRCASWSEITNDSYTSQRVLDRAAWSSRAVASQLKPVTLHFAPGPVHVDEHEGIDSAKTSVREGSGATENQENSLMRQQLQLRG